MTLPSDTSITKLRIIADRERREYERLNAIAYQQYQKANQARAAFIKLCNDLGYCAICEKQKADCKCVFLDSYGMPVGLSLNYLGINEGLIPDDLSAGLEKRGESDV